MEKRFELFEIVIDALNEKNTLDNLILIGGWSQHFYKIYFNNTPEIPVLRTMDIDFLIPRPLKIIKAKLHSIVDMKGLPRYYPPGVVSFFLDK